MSLLNQMERSKTPDLLLVDDDPLICDSLEFLLQSSFRVRSAKTRDEALKQASLDGRVPSLALVDLGLPPFPHSPIEGFALIPELLAINPAMRILVLSGQNGEENLRHAMALGAADFISKPCEPDVLTERLHHHLVLADAAHNEPKVSGDVLEGDSLAMQRLRTQVKQFANVDFPVLIEGESGTGKELVAGMIHGEGKRTHQPYVAVNCAAFSSDLLGSQLFGHARGAFTGAVKDHRGVFEEAAGGTLFLDEIGEMSLELQSNLLRVLENGEYFRVGESRPRKMHARLVAASNRDLLEEVRQGNFREDLYYRLCVLVVKTPPLRERGDDRIILLQHFQSVYSGAVAPFSLSTAAKHLWLSYAFPGNVRELRNVVVRLGTKYPGQNISHEMLEQELECHTEIGSAMAGSTIKGRDDMATRLSQGEFQLDDYLQSVEWECIKTAMQMSAGNLSQAAKLLHVNRTTLHSKVQRLEERFG